MKNILLGNCPCGWLAVEGGNLKDVAQDLKVPEISGHGIFDASELFWEHEQGFLHEDITRFLFGSVHDVRLAVGSAARSGRASSFVERN